MPRVTRKKRVGNKVRRNTLIKNRFVSIKKTRKRSNTHKRSNLHKRIKRSNTYKRIKHRILKGGSPNVEELFQQFAEIFKRENLRREYKKEFNIMTTPDYEKKEILSHLLLSWGNINDKNDASKKVNEAWSTYYDNKLHNHYKERLFKLGYNEQNMNKRKEIYYDMLKKIIVILKLLDDNSFKQLNKNEINGIINMEINSNPDEMNKLFESDEERKNILLSSRQTAVGLSVQEREFEKLERQLEEENQAEQRRIEEEEETKYRRGLTLTQGQKRNTSFGFNEAPVWASSFTQPTNVYVEKEEEPDEDEENENERKRIELLREEEEKKRNNDEARKIRERELRAKELASERRVTTRPSSPEEPKLYEEDEEGNVSLG